MLNEKLNILENTIMVMNEVNEEISPNELLILYAVSIGDKELFFNIQHRCKSNYYFKESIEWLLRKGFINNASEDRYEVKFENLSIVNQHSLEDVNLLDIKFESEIMAMEISKDFIDDWYVLWPVGVRTSNYLVRSGRKPVEKKMKKFVKDYPEYDESIIIEATKQYIKQFKLKGYSYMKTASYFILKDGESTLAGECDRLLHSSKKVGETDIKSSANDSKIL